MSNSRRLVGVWTVLVALALLLAAGCAGKQAPLTTPTPVEPAPVETAEATPEPEPAEPADDLADLEAYFLEDPAETVAPEETVTAAPHDELATSPPELTPEEEQRELELVRKEPVTFDYPMVTNSRVLTWLDYYSEKRGDRFVVSLKRSGRYVDMFREIFAQHGVPQDLIYMAHVESAFKTTAYSRARAKGIFQFIAATGKRYGLRIDYWVDERSDPEKSAHASARYLKDLHDEFGDWYLALAGYNAGEGKIRRALRRSGRKDFWGIARTNYIRRETKNYVPAILAATLIAKDPERYGFDFEYDAPIEYESVQVEGAADLRVLAECAGTEWETLKALNPALRRNQTPPGATTDVRVPPGTGETMLAALAEIPSHKRVLYARHKVRRGDTLSTIARKHRVSVYAIQQANGMGRRTLIRVGQVLRIPTGAPVSYTARSTAVADRSTSVHRVRRGDTLWEIARRYGTTTAKLAALNGIPVNRPLQIGQRLKVRGTASASGVAGTATTYRVRRGDSLWKIAERHGTTPAAIAAASGISVRSILRPGQTLTIVPGSRGAGAVAAKSGGGTVVHTVRRGDSLWRIATRYRTSVEELCALNNISRHAKLYPGTKLTVPVK